MSPEPLRHAPGPRDWSPIGGYEYDAPAAHRPGARQTLTRPARRARRSSALDLGGTSVVVGLLSFGVAAFWFPQTPDSGTILYSAIGALAVIAGVQSLRTHRRGAARRQWPAWAGMALGVVALLSTAFGVANQTWGTTLPTLSSATSAILAVAMPATSDALGPGVAPDGQSTVAQPLPEPPDMRVTPIFTTADEEFEYLARSLEMAVSLIDQQYGAATPESLYVSETGYSYIASDGSVMVGAGEGIQPGFGLTGDGGYTLSLTGDQLGTTAYYDSRAGQILRG